MNHASLFSGIGGFDLAAEWSKWENIFHCEWNPFCQKVLKYHFPKSKSYEDITKTDFNIYRRRIDVLTGGFPCQPYSTAGLRKGKEDERHLWPEMLRAIREIQPRWIVGENVRGLVNWGGGVVFEEVQTDLENQGYEVQPFIIPAASVNAPHRRDRIWFVAYADDKGTSARFGKIQGKNGKISERYNNAKSSNPSNRNFTDSFGLRLEYGAKARQVQGTSRNAEGERSKSSLSFKTNGNGYKSKWENFPTKSAICGGNDGLSGELDGITFSNWRKESIKAYGNAIVPQVAFEIFKAINTFESIENNI